MNKTLISTAALTTAALALSLAAPASADSIGTRDANDSPHGSDLRVVEVMNRDKALVVVTHHDNLRRDPATGSAGSVYIDTNPADRGPEFVFAGGYFLGSDYQLLRTEGFGTKNWGRRVTAGFHEMNVDYDKDTVRMRMTRKSIGQAGKVRIAVRVAGTRSDGTSKGLVDWLREPRSFTPWVAKG